MPRLRHFLVPFAIGAAAGWVTGLLRTPADAKADSSAGAARRLPQEDFGQAPVEVPAAESSEPAASAVVVEPAPPPEIAADVAAAVAPQPDAAAAPQPDAVGAAPQTDAPAPPAKRKPAKPRAPRPARDPDAPKRPRRTSAIVDPEAAGAAAAAEVRRAQTDAVERLGEMERPPGETGG